jgi:hypothetical protein
MKPVDQTTFGVPGGNCFSACVASLLGLPVDDVPYFMADDEWYGRFTAWCEPRGLYPMTFRFDGPQAFLNPDVWTPPGFYILGGASPRGPHAVVARRHEIVHDPHPSRDGLITIEDATVLVPFDLCAGAR